jgi:hypothetical protein
MRTLAKVCGQVSGRWCSYLLEISSHKRVVRNLRKGEGWR